MKPKQHLIVYIALVIVAIVEFFLNVQPRIYAQSDFRLASNAATPAASKTITPAQGSPANPLTAASKGNQVAVFRPGNDITVTNCMGSKQVDELDSPLDTGEAESRARLELSRFFIKISPSRSGQIAFDGGFGMFAIKPDLNDAVYISYAARLGTGEFEINAQVAGNRLTGRLYRVKGDTAMERYNGLSYGCNFASEIVKAALGDYPPYAPTSLRAVNQNGHAHLTWSFSNGEGMPKVTFNIYRADRGTYRLAGTSDSESYDDSLVGADDTFAMGFYYVVAVSANGTEGPSSNLASYMR